MVEVPEPIPEGWQLVPGQVVIYKDYPNNLRMCYSLVTFNFGKDVGYGKFKHASFSFLDNRTPKSSEVLPVLKETGFFNFQEPFFSGIPEGAYPLLNLTHFWQKTV